ncbi:MAG: efflux RND transporter periplasmic adaptor subunit [Opitutaceae bacterium]|nr:efflux RND transporter periplasmic adaptor subunit [Opitutaceae bacterium]
MPSSLSQSAAASQRWLSASAASDTVAALEAEAGPERPWVVGIFLGLLMAGVAALVTIRVDVTVRTWGIVRTRTENAELRSPATASVDSVYVRTGDRVVAGQPLVELANPALKARRDALTAECDAYRFQAQEWITFSEGLEGNDRDTQRESLGFHTSWARRLWDEWVASDAALVASAAQSARELERIEKLAARGLVSDRERDAARSAAESDERARSLARHRQAASATAQRRDAEQRGRSLEGELKQVEEELRTLVLRAPVGGFLMDLAPLRPGAVVVASQVLGSISTDDDFRVEGRVPPRVCALVQPGQRARMSVTALPATEWGLMDAEVEELAPDVSPGTSEPSYRIVLKPQQSALRTRDGRVARLRKGFVAEVRFDLGRASLLTLLRRNVADWISGDAVQPDQGPPSHQALRRISSNPAHAL